jgi:DNA-binding CsgD family transcriptional regulator
MTRRISPAEAEVALLMAIGLTNRQIAALRGTTFATAKYQVEQVLRKTGVARHRLAEILAEVEVRDGRRSA